MASVQSTNCGIGVVAANGGNVTVNGDIHVSQQQDLGLEALSLPKLIKTFQGREKEFEELDCLLFTENKKKIVICGIPGYGKTELSKQYASYCEKNKKIYRAFWVNAESEIELRKSSQELRKIYNAFKGQTCLFVFDNATNRQDTYNYEPPEDENFILLLTSIVTDWDDDVVPFRLEPLPPESVVDVYKSILKDNYQEEDRKLYEQLADVVGNVPLGLQVTGAYVRQQKKRLGKEFKLESYIETLKQSQKEIVNARMPRGTANTYQNSMYGALKVSLEKINNEEVIELRELAICILYLCCYLCPDRLYCKELFDMSNSSEILLRRSHDKTKFMDALGLLENFCFINFYPPGKEIFAMHRFTQNILRFHASEYDPHLQSKCYWVCLQFALFTYTSYTEDIYFITILSHADDNVIIVYNFFQKYGSTNESKRRILRSLSRYGCSKCLTKIFDESGDYRTKQYINKYNLLHATVHNNNHLETLKLLLQYGGDVDNRTFLHDTPLHVAVEARNLDAIKLLIRHNADLNARNYNGDIPLFSLFRDISREEIMNMQLTSVKETPYITFLKRYQEFFKKDTSMGAYEDFHRSSGSYTNMDAIIDILDQLKYGDFKNTTNKNGETLLHIASAARSEKIVKLLIKKYNMDVDKQDLQRRTPLSSLIFRSLDEPYFKEAITTARELITHGAKMDIKDSNGKTVITFCYNKLNETKNIVARALCDNRCVEILKKVFDYLGEQRTKNFITKQYIMHIAIRSNQLDILSLLLQYDVIIKEMNNTPLHTAAICWNSNAIRLLLQHDADMLNVRNSEGETPLFFFIIGARTRHPINLKTANKILNLLQIEYNKHIKDYSGRTLLHASAAVCQEELVALFVNKYKIKTNIKDNSGNTPLQVFISELKRGLHVKKQNVIKIVRILADCDDQLDDNAIYTLAQSLIKENGGDVEKILPCLK